MNENINKSDFLEQFQKMQNMIKEIGEKADNICAVGEAGGGLVKATVNGNRDLLKLEIDSTIIKPDERIMLQDLIIAAINDAMKNVEEQVKGIF